MQVNLGMPVIAVKDTRHGIVKRGTIGNVIAIKDYDEVLKCPSFTVRFPGQIMGFLFANDKTIGRKIQVYRESSDVSK